jgi:hypothetical protein
VTGRPSKLTPALADDLVLLLAARATGARAARAVGVSARSVRRRLRREAGSAKDSAPADEAEARAALTAGEREAEIVNAQVEHAWPVTRTRR